MSSRRARLLSRHNTPIWMVAVILAFIAGMLWSQHGDPTLPSAFAQTGQLAGGRGVYAFTGQIDNSRYGVFMLDIEQGTIWCYEIENSGGARKLHLIAARSWIYDRYLRNFNCAEPQYQAVQELLARERANLDNPPIDATHDRQGADKPVDDDPGH